MEISLSRRLKSFRSLILNTGKCYLISIFWIIILKTISYQLRVSDKDLRNSTAYRQCHIKLVKQEISNEKRKLRILRKDLRSVRNERSLKLSSIDLNRFCNVFLTENHKAISKHKQIQNKILINLKVTRLKIVAMMTLIKLFTFSFWITS